MRQKKTDQDIREEREIGRKLQIFQANLAFIVGTKITKEMLATAFGFTVNQVQQWWTNGKGMPASALYRIRGKGQSLDRLLESGEVTITKEQFATMLKAQELDKQSARDAIAEGLVHERQENYRSAETTEPGKATSSEKSRHRVVSPGRIPKRQK